MTKKEQSAILSSIGDRYDGETFVKAIKAYAAGHPNQRKLFRYAKAMKIEKAVFEIMELVMNERL